MFPTIFSACWRRRADCYTGHWPTVASTLKRSGPWPAKSKNRKVRDIIEALLTELSKATTRAAIMESHFSASLQELDKIRNNLAVAEQRSRTDALTGLSNRRSLEDFLRQAQLSAMETGEHLSILLIDIDHFKQFNDKFGHQFGDQVIRLVAQVLKEGLRENDLAARFGGEELVGVLPGVDVHHCASVAERA